MADERGGGWYELMELSHLLPVKIEAVCGADGKPLPEEQKAEVKMTHATRLLLMILRDHANELDQAWPLRETMASETGSDLKTIDRGLAALTQAGIISSQQCYNPNGTFAKCIRTINRARLRDLVGPRTEDAGLQQALEDAKNRGDGLVAVRETRREQTKRRLFHLAGDFQIAITEEPGGGDYVHLRIRPATDPLEVERVTVDDGAQAGDADSVPDLTPPTPPVTSTKTTDTAGPATGSVEAIAKALTEIADLGAKLSRGEATQLARRLHRTYGEDITLLLLEIIPDAKIEAVVKNAKTSIGGYLGTTLDNCYVEWKAQVIDTLWPQVRSGAVWESALPLTIPRSIIERWRRILHHFGSDEFAISDIRHDEECWLINLAVREKAQRHNQTEALA